MPVLLLTKADVCADTAGVAAGITLPGVHVVVLSAVTGEGVDELERLLRPGETAVLVGPSGVGKSTLANLLMGQQQLRTQAVRRDGKGRHTTTHRELVRLPGGGLLIDTPGLREVGLWAAEDAGVAGFDDVDVLACRCRFRDCAHSGEPGCAVTVAVEAGALDAARLDGWRRLRDELRHLERRADPLLAAEGRARDREAQRALRAQLRRKGAR